MEWQPIETAPKDGTEVLIFDGANRTVGYFNRYWSLSVMGAYAEDDEIYDPTHWMPLPEPPK